MQPGNRLYRPEDFERMKPARGATVNWSNALARNLAFYVPLLDVPSTPLSTGFAVMDMVSKVAKQATTIAQVTSGHFPDLGPCLHHTITATAAIAWSLATTPTQAPKVQALFDGTNDRAFTAAVKFRSDAPIDGGTIFSVTDGTGNTAMGLFHDTTTVVQFHVGGTSLASTGTYAAGQWYTLFGVHQVGSAADRIVLFDRTGILLEDKTGATANPTLGTIGEIRLGYVNSTDGDPWPGSIEWAGMWSGGLDFPSMQALATNPYQLLTRPGRRWSSFPTTVAPPPVRRRVHVIG